MLVLFKVLQSTHYKQTTPTLVVAAVAIWLDD